MTGLQTPEQFYDHLAGHYDELTDAASGRERARLWLEPLVHGGAVRRAADMGCGTGTHVLALSELGVDALGVDIAGEAIMIARRKAEASDLPARFERGDLRSPILTAQAPFDLILCLGNTVPHVESAEQLHDVFLHWRRALSSTGRVVIQMLNYDRILRTRERIINIRDHGGRTDVRFYDFTAPRVTFNILSIDHGGGIRHSLQSTLLTPFLPADVEHAARRAGFADVQFHSSLAFDPLTDEARDIVGIFRNQATANAET